MTKPTQEQLIEAQLQYWPDSKLVSIVDALRWIQEARSITTSDEEEIGRAVGVLTPLGISPEQQREIRMASYARNELVRERRATQVAQSIAVCLANAVESGGPVQFYLCGFNPATGAWRYRGCRYGVEGSEYMSGFGMY